MEKTKVSIIIPNYNRANFIGETLNSVLNQTYPNWEAIIVDDGSTDKSLEIINTFVNQDSRFKIFSRERLPKGPSTCRNIGVEKSKGEYLIFLDSDDLLADFCLEQRIKFMNDNPELDFAVFNLELFNKQPGDLAQIFNKIPKKGDSYLEMFLRNDLPWACPNPIWKKSSFQILGGFNEDLIIMEDPELHTRALLEDLKYKVIIDSSADCYYRQSDYSKEKMEYFYDLSIKGRICYIKIITNTIIISNSNNKRELLKKLRYSVVKLIKTFMLGRIKNYKLEYYDILHYSKVKKIINYFHYLKLLILGYFFLNDNTFVKTFKLKGFLYKILT